MPDTAPWVRYPTPVIQGAGLGTDCLWIKNDGLSGVPYGGNKARKLVAILEQADERRARRLVTAGAAGSHHVLATTVYGRLRGYRVAAYLWPQEWTPHAQATFDASVSQGLELTPVSTPLSAAARLMMRHANDDFVVAIGGYGLAAAAAYARAVEEITADVARGVLPEPDEIVVAVGTGSTAAGLLAGVVRAGLRSTVVGVSVAWNPVAAPLVVSLAARTLKALGSPASVSTLLGRLRLDSSRVGRGYGYPTTEGDRATEAARRTGLELDPTYTAKAFARALASAGARGFSLDPSGRQLRGTRKTLYWHTLSAYPLSPLVKPEEGTERARGPTRSLFRDRPSDLP